MNPNNNIGSLEQNKEVARKFYELIGSRKYDEAAGLCHPQFVYIPQVGRELKGAQAFSAIESANMDPFGEFKMKNEFMIAENDRVAVYLTFEGDLQGDSWLGIPVSKKHLHIDFMCMLKFKDGKIIEKRAKYNMVDHFRQLGVKNLPL